MHNPLDPYRPPPDPATAAQFAHFARETRNTRLILGLLILFVTITSGRSWLLEPVVYESSIEMSKTLMPEDAVPPMCLMPDQGLMMQRTSLSNAHPFLGNAHLELYQGSVKTYHATATEASETTYDCLCRRGTTVTVPIQPFDVPTLIPAGVAEAP